MKKRTLDCSLLGLLLLIALGTALTAWRATFPSAAEHQLAQPVRPHAMLEGTRIAMVTESFGRHVRSSTIGGGIIGVNGRGGVCVQMRGAGFTLYGPSESQLIDAETLQLNHGRARIYPHSSTSAFRLRTATSVISGGDVYLVDTDQAGKAEVFVETGTLRVEVECSALEVRSGEAIAIDSSGVAKPIEFDESRFDLPY